MSRNVSKTRTDNHVQRVHARHREIDPVKHLDLFDRRARQQDATCVDPYHRVLRDFRTKWTVGNQVTGNQVVVIFVLGTRPP